MEVLSSYQRDVFLQALALLETFSPQSIYWSSFAEVELPNLQHSTSVY